MTEQIEVFKTINFISEPKFQEEILEKSSILCVNEGEVIVREGEYVKVLPIVIEGAIRVFQTREDREILLYYVEPGQTCMMSLSACFFNSASAIEAIAISPTKVLSLPINHIAEWQRKYSSWNNFVLKTFRKRYDELLGVFTSVAFDNIDKRVWDYLRSQQVRQDQSIINISHLQLARELGTTRVVVSRILKQFELDEKLILHRGSIELL